MFSFLVNYFYYSQHSLISWSSLHRIKSCGIYLIHISMSVIVATAQFMLKHLCWWKSQNIDSDVTRRYNFTVNTLILQLLWSFFPLFCIVPWEIPSQHHKWEVLTQVVMQETSIRVQALYIARGCFWEVKASLCY